MSMICYSENWAEAIVDIAVVGPCLSNTLHMLFRPRSLSTQRNDDSDETRYRISESLRMQSTN